MKPSTKENFKAGLYSGLSGYTDKSKAAHFTVEKCNGRVSRAYWLGVRCGLTKSGKWAYSQKESSTIFHGRLTY